jgi:hypothetical protein
MQHGHQKIQVMDIELAYLDLFEILNHTYNYIQKKVPGTLSDSETWQGASDQDKETLLWLYSKGATSAESTVTLKEYKTKIEEVFRVQDRQAANIYIKQRDQGLIKTKQGYQHTKVWITFKPEGAIITNMHKHAKDAHALTKDAIEEKLLLNNNKYYYIYNKYYNNGDLPQSGSERALHHCNFMQVYNSTPSTPLTATVTDNAINVTPTRIPMREYDSQGQPHYRS